MKNQFLFRAALCCLALLSPGIRLTSAQDMQTITYAPSAENFPNPERGFYHQDAPLWLGDERVPQNTDDLRALRAQGIALVRWYFLIDEYRESDLDADVLVYIEQQLNNARAAGIKVIPRFAYNFPTNGEYPYSEPDATLGRVLAHLDQLAPLFERSSDVIAFVEAGLIGAWGEWHSSTNGLIDEESGVTPAARAIVNRWLQILPPYRSIALRYPLHKQQLYGPEPLDAAIAYSGVPSSRIGAHNDCFLASATDWGTYAEDPAIAQAERDYLHDDNRYVPQGGETCNADEDARPFIGCDNALSQLAYLRYSALNIDYNTAVLDVWRSEGCFETIAQRLGYRLRLTETTLPLTGQAGQALPITLTLVNDGFASPYNGRAFYVVLRSSADGRDMLLTPDIEIDPRLWLPDAGEITLDFQVLLPSALASGDYQMLLLLPDPLESLAQRPEYAVRLANEGVWEADTGYNRLLATVSVRGN